MKTKLIFCLLLIILCGSCVLIYKIEHTHQKYDSKLYNQIYEEYNHISAINSELQNSTDITQNSSTTVVFNKNSSGTTYMTIGILSIPKINISYPIINACTEENLNIAPTKLLGPTPNTVGNLVIVGHNNWNKEFFSNLHKLENGDIVTLKDSIGNNLTYKVYDKYEIKQDDFSCLEQNTNNKIELTLLTCVKYKKNKRLVVKCVADI